MTNDVIALLVLVLITLITIAFIFQRHRKQKQNIKTGLTSLMFMRQIIELVQQHRGLSNMMYLSGTDVEKQLQEIHQKVDALVQSPFNTTLSKYEQWDSFLDHWPRLRAVTLRQGLSARESMRQHNVMINTHLYLLDELAHDFGLHRVKLDQKHYMLGLCIDTLRTSEMIAIARGVGSGLCNSGGHQKADMLSLSFIKNTMGMYSSDLFNELSHIDNAELNTYFSQSSQDIMQSVNELVSAIDEKVLDEEKSVDTQEYFSLASKPISQLAEVYQKLIDHVANQYDINFKSS